MSGDNRTQPALARSKWLLVVVVFAVLTGLRLYDLPNQPYAVLQDELWFAQDALLLRSGDLACCPLYFNVPFGGHPLFVYLSLGVQALGVPPAWAGRLVSAVASSLSLAVAFGVFWQMGHQLLDDERGWWLALAGTFALGTTFLHLVFSRVGLETLLATDLAIGYLGLLWLAFERRSYGLALAAGIVVGISLYAYAPAIVFVAFSVPLGGYYLWRERDDWRRVAALTLTVLVAAGVVYLPLLLTILADPNAYIAHLLGTTQSSRALGLLGTLQGLARDLWRLIAGISFTGDTIVERNIPGRPLLDAFVSLLFWPGLAALVWQARRHSAATFWLLWFGLTALPVWLTDQTPSFARWTPALPAFAFSIGLGAMMIVQWLRQYGGQTAARLGVGAVVVLLALSGHQTASAYFGGLGTNRPAYQQWSTAARATADAIRAAADAGDLAYITPTGDAYLQPALDVLLHNSDVQAVNGQQCLPLAWDEPRDTTYAVVDVTDKASAARLAELYGDDLQLTVQVPDTPNPWDYAQVYRVPAGTAPRLATPTPADACFAGGLNLASFDLPSRALAPGEWISVTLYWRAWRVPDDRLHVFVHVVPAGGRAPVAQHDSMPCGGFSTRRWQPGGVYVDEHTVVPSPELAPGVYDVRAGVYQLQSGERKPVLACGSLEADGGARYVELGQIRVRGP